MGLCYSTRIYRICDCSLERAVTSAGWCWFNKCFSIPKTQNEKLNLQIWCGGTLPISLPAFISNLNLVLSLARNCPQYMYCALAKLGSGLF